MENILFGDKTDLSFLAMEWIILILGILTLTTSSIIRSYFPKPKDVGIMPAGFTSPVLAFEFIRSQQELSDLFNITPPARREQVVNRVNTGNRVDFGFAVLYSLLSASLAYFLLGKAGLPEQWQWLITIIAVLLSLTAGTCDVLENRTLLLIADKQSLSVQPLQLRRLTRLVTTKFTSLTLALALMLPFWLHIIQAGTTVLKLWAGLTTVVLVVALAGAFMVVRGRRVASQWLLWMQLIGMTSAWAYIIYLLLS